MQTLYSVLYEFSLFIYFDMKTDVKFFSDIYIYNRI